MIQIFDPCVLCACRRFYTCFLHAVMVITGVWIVERKVPRYLGWLQFCYHISMIYLFTWKLKWVPMTYLSLSDIKTS